MSKDRLVSHVLSAEGEHDDARYRATFRHAGIGIAHTAPDGTLLDANPALQAILGYARRDLLPTRLPDLLLRNDQGALTGSRNSEDCVEKLPAGEIKAHTCTEQYRHEQGPAVWVRRTVSLASDDTGRPYLIHFIEDITARKRAEEQQRLTDLRYQRRLESALDCIVSTDHRGRIIEFNSVAERVFGYARARK